ncbi:MAG: flavin reductase [Lewinellaceae bacterium]|nr:flavin reductase [Saprospiraceae bacterium]MCB9337946.1 flavin reductase [Lewinellaceae bacterium]
MANTNKQAEQPERKYRTIDPGSVPRHDFHQFIVGSVAPRPIAFVSTVDKNGTPNLAPYSFFNAFSSNPPIFVFSSNRRVGNNTTKDTLANVEETREVVINVVSYNIVRQMAVASAQFDKGVNEFIKSGLTPIPSDLVKPYRVQESPINMECRVNDIIPLGTEGGAGHLIICEMLRMHILEDVLDERGRIVPDKLDLMGRLGRSYYVRASGGAVHTIVQSIETMCIGFDQLPDRIRYSSVFTGNNLGQLAGLSQIPAKEEVLALRDQDARIKEILASGNPLEGLHHYAKEVLESDEEARPLAGRIAWLGEYL